MKRVLLQALLAVGGMFFFLHLAFAQKLTVSWGACELSDRSVVFSLENTYNLPLPAYQVQVSVFQGNELVSSQVVRAKKPLMPNKTATFFVPTARSLRKARSYRVVATLKTGDEAPLQRTWENCLVARTSNRGKAFLPRHLFPELDILQNPIAGIKLQTAMKPAN